MVMDVGSCARMGQAVFPEVDGRNFAPTTRLSNSLRKGSDAGYTAWLKWIAEDIDYGEADAASQGDPPSHRQPISPNAAGQAMMT